MSNRQIDHICIIGNELELACNGGSSGGNKLSLKIFACEKIPCVSLILEYKLNVAHTFSLLYLLNQNNDTLFKKMLNDVETC